MLAVITLATGTALVVGIVAVGAVALVLWSSCANGASGDRYPDQRSNHHRIVWTDDHNRIADSDTDHNWEADGNRPW